MTPVCLLSQLSHFTQAGSHRDIKLSAGPGWPGLLTISHPDTNKCSDAQGWRRLSAEGQWRADKEAFLGPGADLPNTEHTDNPSLPGLPFLLFKIPPAARITQENKFAD